MVVRFKGSVSLIQFIQLRGRARKEGANFYLIVTDEEQKNAIEIEKQENILGSILSNASEFSAEARDILDRMEVSEIEQYGSFEAITENNFEYCSESVSFYIPGYSFDINGMDVINCITEAFRDIIHVELKKRQLYPGKYNCCLINKI